MVKDKGLNCNLIISRLPAGAPVTQRAIPVAIFSADPAVKTFYLRKWLKDSTLDCQDFRDVVDWEYYKDRLGKSIQKIITIPAGVQRIANPCPRVEHPVWLKRILQEKMSGLKQGSISHMFRSAKAKSGLYHVGELAAEGNTPVIGREPMDIEDIASSAALKLPPVSHVSVSVRKRKGLATEDLPRLPEDNPPIENSISDSSPLGEDIARPAPPILTDQPKSMEDLQRWLQSRKLEWSSRRTSRSNHAERFLASTRQYGLTTDSLLYGPALSAAQNTQSTSRKKAMGIDDLVRNAALAVTHGFWQIVELQETEVPGSFIAWSFTGPSQLQKLYVTIPRIIYANCRGGKAEETAKQLGGRVVKKDLPHSRPVYNLYEIQLQEHKYIRNEKALDLFLCDTMVEGVYETKTPLWFRAVTRLGCIVNVMSSEIGSGKDGNSVDTAFKLKDLRFVNVSSHKYLEADVARYRQIFVYHAEDPRRTDVGIVGVFIISDNNMIGSEQQVDADRIITAKASVWLCQPRGTLSERPPLHKIFRRFCPNELSICKFTTHSVVEMSEAFAKCNELLSSYVRERRGPTIVVSQGVHDARTWRRLVPLLHQFPLVSIPANTKDSLFPPLAWQVRICNIMVQRFLLFPQWFEDRLSCARYAHIPLGNLGREVNLIMTDVLIARQLEVLWAAPGPLPDLGGAETDLHSAWVENLSEQTISEPGAYRSICVELEIFGLAVAGIMGSAFLDAQGITSVSAVPSVGGSSESRSSSVSNDAACARTFNLLKATVAKWIHEVGLNGDLHADSLLMGLYRYLCGKGRTLLHDTSLFRVVYILMTKLFVKLVLEFRRLGCKIVYADFYRLIIATQRYEYRTAKELIQFVVDAVLERELFQCLQINVKCMYEQLLWVDSANWGGIKILNPEEVSPKLGHASPPDPAGQTEWDHTSRVGDDDFDDSESIPAEAEEESSDSFANAESASADGDGDGEEQERNSNRGLVEGSWDMISSLPAAAAIYLRSAIDQFLLVYREQWSLAVAGQRASEQGDTPNLFSINYTTCKESVVRYMQNLIRHRLGPQLLQTVDILLHQYSLFLPEHSISTSHGNHNHQVVLAFVKSITRVLSLDDFLAEEVSALRRTLLTQLSVKEFNVLSDSDESSESYVLRDVICSYCNTCRDVDLLRDPLISGKGKGGQDDPDSSLDNAISGRKATPNWLCVHCSNLHDSQEIEQRLLDDLEGLIASFLLQDFRCSKTREVSVRVCSAVSDLSAAFTMDFHPHRAASQLDLLLKVARLHKFDWLEEEILSLTHHQI